MKKLLLLGTLTVSTTSLALANSTILISQFFNNTGGDKAASGYNWNVLSAGNVATPANLVSQGVVFAADYSPRLGERNRGTGFLFGVADVGTDVPSAWMLYTNHLGVTNNSDVNIVPQPDWFSSASWAGSTMSNLQLSDLSQVRIATNNGNAATTLHLALNLQGIGWVVTQSSVSSTAWAFFTYDNLLNQTWLTGAFDGTTVAASPSIDTMTPTGNEIVVGFGIYALTGNLAGGNSRVRLDSMELTVIPEPSTYAMIFGLMILGFVAWRRRK